MKPTFIILKQVWINSQIITQAKRRLALWKQLKTSPVLLESGVPVG